MPPPPNPEIVPAAAPSTVRRPTVLLHAGLLLLAFGSGATDAFAFLSLGGIFTGMMTGNLVLMGMFTRPEFLQVLLGAALAVSFFAAGAFVGFRALGVRGGKTVAPRVIVSRLLGPSLIAQASAATVWIAVPSGTGSPVTFVIVVLLAIALALQAVAAKKASDVTGITTTYVTGTLTTTMEEWAAGTGRGNALRLLTVLALPVGAACATALVWAVPWSAPILPVGCACVATGLLHRALTRSAQSE